MNKSLSTGKVIWLTGLSGAGKTTIANHLQIALELEKYLVCILDGDELRMGLNQDLGFCNKDRSENIRRTAEVAKLIKNKGFIVIAALISPFNSDREYVRTTIGNRDFIEVYVNTPLEICELRDPKGLYKKARQGLVTNMTGIQSAYEAPKNPDLIIDTSNESISQNVKRIKKILDEKNTLI